MADAPPPVAIAVVPLTRELLDGLDDPERGPGHRVDLAVLPCFEDERPLQGLAGLCDWRTGGQLSAMLRDGFWSGASGEAVLLPGRRTLPMERLVLLGLGPSARFDRARAEAVGERMVGLVEGIDPRDVLVAMPGRGLERALVEAVFDGLTRALAPSLADPADALAQPAARAVGDDSSPTLVSEAVPAASVVGAPPTRAAEDGVVPLEAAGAKEARSPDGSGSERGVTVAVAGRSEPGGGSESSARGGDPEGGSGGSQSGRRWWVVADPRHEARLRRLLDGPPRAAGV